MTSLSNALRSDRGAVLPWFVIWLPVLIVFVVLVIDVGNWFEHKRHLQMQADAAALAGAGKFRLPLSLCDDALVKETARQYAGDHEVPPDETVLSSFFPGDIYNSQIGATPPERMHALINFDARELDDPDYPGDFWRSADDDDGSSPCEDKFIEVKMTETDLPWFFGVPPSIVHWIDASARVSLQGMGTSSGALPIGVPETDPDAITVKFMNECTDTVITTTALAKVGSDGDLVVWANSGLAPGPVSVTMPDTCKKVGVRVAIASRGTSSDCANQFVDCYEAGTLKGAGLVRSYPTTPAGTATAPQLRGVELFPSTLGSGCVDPYFFSDKKPCSAFGVRATVDFGGAVPSGGFPKVDVRFDNKNPWVSMTYNATTGVWETAENAFAPVDNQGKPLEGPHGVQMRWIGQDVCKGNGCDFEGGGSVHRTYGGADQLSGPIKMLQVFNSGVRSGSEAAASSPSLVVTLKITSSLKVAADVNDPIVALRLVGNQTQALNCDVDFNTLSDELAYGCGQRVPPATPTSPFAELYTENTGQMNCRATNKTTLWANQAGNSSSPPWPCVAISTGHSTNQIPRGLNLRVLGNEKPTTCTSPNNWNAYPDVDPDDPRIVQVFITPFGAFAGTGNDETVPVVGFATFYVTGWTGQGSGFDNPCQGFVPPAGSPATWSADDPVPNNDPGTIVGHFIKYIASFNSGSNGEECDENSLTPCVAVLTG